jgi:hypothetical protein
MTDRIEIGRVCYKGPHAYFVGDPDYRVCGSHEYATIYLTIEQNLPNPRGEVYTLEEARERIAEAFAAAETHSQAAESRFTPTPERMAELVVAANQRAERIAQRLLRAERYAARKGDVELAALLAVADEEKEQERLNIRREDADA